MPATQEPRSGLNWGWDLGESGWKTGMDANLLWLGRFGTHLSVKDRHLATPPGSPASGDTYIVAATATGAWTGMEGKVAIWDATNLLWVFGTPRTGWRAYIEDEGVELVYAAGAWISKTLKAVAEAVGTPTSNAGALTLNLADGNIAETTLTENITALTLSNPPASGKAGKLRWIIHQDATGGRTVAWPASVKWGTAGAPTLSAAANAVDIIDFETTDGGATWRARVYGLGY